jgi:hypothetical protein
VKVNISQLTAPSLSSFLFYTARYTNEATFSPMYDSLTYLSHFLRSRPRKVGIIDTRSRRRDVNTFALWLARARGAALLVRLWGESLFGFGLERGRPCGPELGERHAIS